jgi:DNA-directed RNA polymerase subunit beta'
LKTLILWTFQHYGAERAFEVSERLKNIGFRIATKAGFSIGIEDLLIPKEKRWAIRLTERKVKKSEIYEKLGATTLFEKEKKID